MIILLQRVTEARVEVAAETVGEIGSGLLVFLGIESADGDEDIEWLTKKLIGLRIFDDEGGQMNRSLADVGGSVLLVSQFTLHARTKKGTRPSYTDAAPPNQAEPLYDAFGTRLRDILGAERVATGRFGAHMKVSLLNDGPVTLSINSRDRR
ncbi:MAG: D-aminoacyl-tRNA deacylase [Verrucomicrobiota bacterium]